jgi:undecaprenyl-diphosphatase
MTIQKKTDSAKKLIPLPTAHELLVLLIFFVIIAGTLAFITIAGEVRGGNVQYVDELILTAFRQSDDLSKPRGPLWLSRVMRDITALGGVTVIFSLTLFVLGFLLLQKHYRTMILIGATSLGGFILVIVLKFLIARDRPNIVPPLIIENTPSFPSGHSMMSAVVYLSLAALLARIQPTISLRIYIILIALLLTFLIGTSRIYLGVHYPTDVLSGWSVGLAWASFCWYIAFFMEKRE